MMEVFDVVLEFVQQNTTLKIIQAKKPSGVIKTLNNEPNEFLKCVIKIKPIKATQQILWITITKSKKQDISRVLNYFNQLKTILMNFEESIKPITSNSNDNASVMPNNPNKTVDQYINKICPLCNVINEQNARFCASCGTEFK